MHNEVRNGGWRKKEHRGIICEGTSTSVVYFDYKVCVAVYRRGCNSQ